MKRCFDTYEIEGQIINNIYPTEEECLYDEINSLLNKKKIDLYKKWETENIEKQKEFASLSQNSEEEMNRWIEIHNEQENYVKNNMNNIIDIFNKNIVYLMNPVLKNGPNGFCNYAKVQVTYNDDVISYLK